MVDRSRFEQLALPHRDAAYNLAYWIVRNRDDAEDVVQDAYLRAFRAFAGFEGEAIRPWLLTIVRHAAYRWLERRQRSSNVIAFNQADAIDVDALQVASLEPTAEEVLISHGEQRLLREALGQLPLVYRDVVVLRELEEFSYTQIAEICGIAVGTVMSRLSRGRALLRDAVARGRAKDGCDAL